jgi:eukaryotic-like serine/threonine-protein kinase
MSAFVPVAGAVVAGKFQLEQPLARGGMGAIWTARHLELDTRVAIKFMEEPDKIRNARARFEREARALAKLRSPHVVQVLDYGIDRDTPYLVMELLEGEDLRERLVRIKRMPLRDVADLVRQLALGLELAHQAGVVHRDIKLSNVFLARVGNMEIAKILDFGVAKGPALAGDGHYTTSTELVGSPAFMSPEQARGAEVTHLSDLWSLGVVVYVSLTGSLPFSGEHVGDLLVRICTEPLQPIGPEFPPALDSFFQRALCRSPDGRFPSASAFSAALSAMARGESPRDDATIDATRDVSLALPSGTIPKEPRSRAWLYLLGGAAAVALAWVATQSLRTEEPTEASPVSEPSPPPTAIAEPPASASAAPSASAVASTETPPMTKTPWRPRPPPPAKATVDPKFGLPQ